MTTTINVTVTLSTMMVQATIYQTALTTVLVTVDNPPFTYQPSATTMPTSNAGFSSATASPSTPIDSLILSFAPSSTLSFGELPSVSLPSISSTQESEPSLGPTDSPTAASSSLEHRVSPSSKNAIIAGLAGAIGGLMLIGLLVFLVMRARRKQANNIDNLDEKQDDSAIANKWTGLGTRRGTSSPMPPVLATTAVSGVSVDEDHHMIRMSTQHWPRPFAHDAKTGYRDSIPPGQLFVTNPDPARPPSSRLSSETMGEYLRRKRTAVSEILFGSSHSHSRTESSSQRHPLSQEVAASDVNRVSSYHNTEPPVEAIAGVKSAIPPSVKSIHSILTRSIIIQDPPEDPFTTPSPSRQRVMRFSSRDLEANIEARSPSERNFSLRAAASATTRAVQHIGSSLHPPRLKQFAANIMGASPPPSAKSVDDRYLRPRSRNSSRASQRSDPFDLDRPSVRGSATSAIVLTPSAPEFYDPGRKISAVLPHQSWKLYEGT